MTIWTSFKRALLGKSSSAYMQQFCGGYDYQEALRTAHGGRPAAPVPAATEPVHGWTDRQLKEYLARNPAYEAIYQDKLARSACHAQPTKD